MKLGSDHFPIMLVCGSPHQGRRPLKFENMWLKVDGFVDKVQQWWDNYHFQGFPSFILANKLKALKFNLRNWNAEEFGNVTLRKNELLAELNVLDANIVSHIPSVEERVRKEIVIAEVEHLILMEEISWRKKSQVLWLKEGDKNSKFFHRIANLNRNRSSIGQLSINGVVSMQHAAIQEHIVQFYEQLCTEGEFQRPLLDGLESSGLFGEDLEGLDRPFSVEEVLNVVKNFNGDKSPSPDGYSMAFYQAFWSVVGSEVMVVCQEFYEQGFFEKSLNATFICLIPKKPRAIEWKDFRPISLVGSVYKIIAKVLANRLSLVLAKLISSPQNAFVKEGKS